MQQNGVGVVWATSLGTSWRLFYKTFLEGNLDFHKIKKLLNSMF